MLPYGESDLHHHEKKICTKSGAYALRPRDHGRKTQLRGRIGYRRQQQHEKDLLLNGRASRPTFCSGTQPKKGGHATDLMP
jgi:hypothetical protein